LNIPIRVPKAFRVIAHRGSSAYAPENTLPAFRLARKMGFGEIELGVGLTTDGVVVLCHDLVLTRYGHGDVVVEEWRRTSCWLWIWGRGFRRTFSQLRRC